MNKRHKTVLALTLAIAGLELVTGSQISESLGIILIGAGLAWLIGSAFVLALSATMWKYRVYTVIAIVFATGTFYGWTRYASYRDSQREAAYRAKMKPLWDCETRNSQFSNAEAECSKDASAVLYPLQIPVAASAPVAAVKANRSVRQPTGPRYVKTLQDTDLSTSAWGSLTCGHLAKGEQAVLLADDVGQVRIRTSDGKIGWAYSGNFEVVTDSR